MSQINNKLNSDDDIQAAMFADCLANSKEIFALIEAVFPLDSCRHYQVLPLKLEGKDLTLGMLDPNNEESLNFVKSIAKVFKYNLDLKLIDTQTHEIILASYPQKNQQPKKQEGNYDRTIVDTSLNSGTPLNVDVSSRRILTDSAPTIVSQPESQSLPTQSNNSDVFKDLPPDLDFLRDWNLTEQPQPKQSRPTDNLASFPEDSASLLNQQQSINPDDQQTIISEEPAKLLAREQSQYLQEPQIVLSEAQISDLAAETSVDPQEILEFKSAPVVDFLAEFKPQFSWQKLLEQSLEQRIEQLNFIQYSDYGSIIASKKNVTQSELDHIPLPAFCSVIDEIKEMAKLPLDSNAHPRKVVFEKIHEQERILVRVEFSLQDQSEETDQKDFTIVQILRDEALTIYEQQQIEKISEQALKLAHELEKTLRKFHACFDSAKLTNLTELQTVQSRIKHQLEILSQ